MGNMTQMQQGITSKISVNYNSSAAIPTYNFTNRVDIIRNPEQLSILQSTNLYEYCMNNPVLFTDSTGTVAWGKGVTVYGAFGIRLGIQAYYVEDDKGNKGIITIAEVGGGNS